MLLGDLKSTLRVQSNLLRRLVRRYLQGSRWTFMGGQVGQRAGVNHGLDLIDQGMGRLNPLGEDNTRKASLLTLEPAHALS